MNAQGGVLCVQNCDTTDILETVRVRLFIVYFLFESTYWMVLRPELQTISPPLVAHHPAQLGQCPSPSDCHTPSALSLFPLPAKSQTTTLHLTTYILIRICPLGGI